MLSPRPYVVHSKFIHKSLVIATLCLLAGLGCAFGGAFWFVHAAQKIAHDQQLWLTGETADGVRVGGTSTSHSFVINDYKLDVHYLDAQALAHDGKAEFELLFTSVDDHEPVDVKYDPGEPSRFVVSWAVTHVAARWACACFLSLTFILMGLGLGLLAARRIRAVSDAKHVAERSDEVHLELVSVTPVVVKGKHSANIIRFRHNVAGRMQEQKQNLPVGEQPMYTSDAKTHLVALVSAHVPHRPWLMREDHHPFVGATRSSGPTG